MRLNAIPASPPGQRHPGGTGHRRRPSLRLAGGVELASRKRPKFPAGWRRATWGRLTWPRGPVAQEAW